MLFKKSLCLLLAIVMLFGSALPAAAEETEKATQLEASYAGLSNPRIVADSSMKSGQKVTWDCIYFGSYPQAEVVSSSSYGAVGSEYLQKGDLIVDSSLYTQLKDATWTNNITTINGVKYQRIQKTSATYSTLGSSEYYNWSASSAKYRYFKYEPIKWRVLSIEGSTALILADKALDDQMYNTEYTSVTWETSTIRTWLNGTFRDRAFSTTEQGAIVSTTVVNNDNNYYKTEGGNNTTDQVFLLAESEVYTNESDSKIYGGNAQQYGFASLYNTSDEARRCKSTTYAKAMGTWWSTSTDNVGNCWWWLRSPGGSTKCTTDVTYGGVVYQYGNDISNCKDGVRPALKINLTSSNLWSNAGIVNSDGTTTLKLTSKNASISISKTEYAYTGSAIKPTVTVKYNGTKLVKDTDYTVKYSNNTKVGTATLAITGKGKYSGTLTKTFKIIPKKGYLKSVTPGTKSLTVKMTYTARSRTGQTGTYYQIGYKRKGSSTWKYATTTSQSKTIGSLTTGKQYYVKVRAYKTVSGTKYRGAWSEPKLSGAVK